MKGPLALCLAVLLVAGCRSPGQPNDPFFGRATVEPPRTGAVAGNRAAPYYSGAPAPSAAPTTAPRAPVVSVPNTTTPNATNPGPWRYAPAQPQTQTYGSSAPSPITSPATTQPRLLPGSGSAPLASPQVSMPLATPAPVSTPQPTVAPPAVVAPPATTAPALAPVTPQPALPAAPVGPTLRPAASIPAVPLQSQWSPRDPCSGAAGRQRIVRPLVPRSGCNPCPPGTVPVPCVPSYAPASTPSYAPSYAPACTPSYAPPSWQPSYMAPQASLPASTGPVNIADLPEPRGESSAK